MNTDNPFETQGLGGFPPDSAVMEREEESTYGGLALAAVIILGLAGAGIIIGVAALFLIR